MKTFIVILSFTFLTITAKPYTWNPIGPDSANISDICFGVALQRMVLCADDGMYLYNYSTYETEYYTYANMPVLGAAHLNAEKFIVIMSDGSWSDGIYTFDINTFQFEVVEWIANPTFLYFNEQNATYYAGFHFGGLYSSTDGLNWNEIPYFNSKSCVDMCSWGEHLVVSTASIIAGIHCSDDAGVIWTESINWPPLTFEMQFSPDGVLYAVHPGISYSSGLYKSYDYGETWDIEFWWAMMSAVGFNVFGNKFVGLITQDPELYGIAYFEMDAIWEPNFTMFNDGLGNTNINKIKVNPTMSAPALFVCTEGGVYYSYDLMVGTQTLNENKSQIDIFPNPASSSGLVNISMPETSENILIQLYNTKGEEVFEWIFNHYNSVQYFQFRLPNLKAGVYYVQCKSSKGNVVKKLIIQ